ncbi:MAG TPA: FCD domain-containing protein [Bacteroidales bacterium]|nr:FCD domain-containing protein [Bacteroidales bacterium]HPJ60818.1 FCD domain-containing protein [Bacteroidales bacterium]HPR13588.1 FCD domain-containing protein [Bacteroidales bacterium]HRW86550.1 FCD domain-containing protein [Bacteroidales bacterium]
MKNADIKSYITGLDTRNLVDKAETKLIEIFIKKDLKPGDPIPKETELAEAMGVSRTVIRESLTRLKAMDIIEAKKHKGTVIKSPNFFSVLQKSLIPNIIDENTLKDFFELRLVLEIGMADLLVSRVTPDDIKNLEKIIAREPEKSEHVLFDIEHEIKFHSRLYQISGNDSLIRFQNLLLPIFNYAYKAGLMQIPIKKSQYCSHRHLVEMLRDGDAEKLRNGMRAHLDNHFRRIYMLAEAAKGIQVH